MPRPHRTLLEGTARIAWLPLLLLLATTARAQDTTGPDLATAMQQLSDATTRLGRMFDDDAAARPPGELLQQMRGVLPVLSQHAATMPSPELARATVAQVEAAIGALEKPSTSHGPSGRYDFAALRGACTRCHLHNRDGNDERGWFPNRDGLVHGTVRLLDRQGAPVADADGLVVFLESARDRPQPLPREPRISQRGRRFDPAVLVVTTGTTVEFPNDDVVFHNVFSLSRGNAFDLGTYGKGKARRKTMLRPGLVKVHCNIHADMSSHVLVLNTRRAAVTDAGGHWHIPDVPPGTYTLRVWHALAKGLRQELVVDPRARIEVPLEVREDRVRAPHTNKHGRAYKKKY
jgi:hypothetical protein